MDIHTHKGGVLRSGFLPFFSALRGSVATNSSRKQHCVANCAGLPSDQPGLLTSIHIGPVIIGRLYKPLLAYRYRDNSNLATVWRGVFFLSQDQENLKRTSLSLEKACRLGPTAPRHDFRPPVLSPPRPLYPSRLVSSRCIPSDNEDFIYM